MKKGFTRERAVEREEMIENLNNQDILVYGKYSNTQVHTKRDPM
jgi:hypothetical protein